MYHLKRILTSWGGQWAGYGNEPCPAVDGEESLAVAGSEAVGDGAVGAGVAVPGRHHQDLFANWLRVQDCGVVLPECIEEGVK